MSATRWTFSRMVPCGWPLFKENCVLFQMLPSKIVHFGGPYGAFWIPCDSGKLWLPEVGVKTYPITGSF